MAPIGVATYPITLPAPQPPRYGLVQTAQVVPDADEHWLGGGEARRWYEDCLGVWSGNPPEIQDRRTSSREGNAKSDACRELATVKAQPFTVEAAYTCFRGYIESEQMFQQRAMTAFAAFEPLHVEAQFWAGALGVDMPYLDDGNADDASGGAVKPLLGLALLEQAIAESDVSGVIHMRPAVAAMLGSTNLATQANTITTEVLGTPVAVGSGYPGTSGGAALADQKEFMYASGPVVIRRSAPQVLPSLDHDTNAWVVRIERDYLILFDTQLQAVVQVDKATV